MTNKNDKVKVQKEAAGLKKVLLKIGLNDSTDSEGSSNSSSETENGDSDNLSSSDIEMTKNVRAFESKRKKNIIRYFNQFKPKESVKIIESDFLVGDKTKIQNDVYSLTIGLNMTKLCTPLELNYCLK